MDERREVVTTEPTSDPLPVIRRHFASDAQFQLNPARFGQRSKLLFIGEFARRSRAEEQSDGIVRHIQRVMEHGPQRRDAGSARDEEKSSFSRLRRKGKASVRTVDVDEGACLEGQIA